MRDVEDSRIILSKLFDYSLFELPVYGMLHENSLILLIFLIKENCFWGEVFKMNFYLFFFP
jgi:hypothetical protein